MRLVFFLPLVSVLAKTNKLNVCQVLITNKTGVSFAVHCLSESEMSWLIINCFVIAFFRFYPLITILISRKTTFATLRVVNCEKIRSHQPAPCSPKCLIYSLFFSLSHSRWQPFAVMCKTTYLFLGHSNNYRQPNNPKSCKKKINDFVEETQKKIHFIPGEHGTATCGSIMMNRRRNQEHGLY